MNLHSVGVESGRTVGGWVLPSRHVTDKINGNSWARCESQIKCGEVMACHQRHLPVIARVLGSRSTVSHPQLPTATCLDEQRLSSHREPDVALPVGDGDPRASVHLGSNGYQEFTTNMSVKRRLCARAAAGRWSRKVGSKM